jgi:mannosyltransferase PIG-V
VAVDAMLARVQRLPSIHVTLPALNGWWRDLVIIFVMNRAIVMLCATVAFALHPQQDIWGWSKTSPTVGFLSALSPFDGGWYYSVAHDGYSYTPGQESSIAFTPLLPLIMHIGGSVVGSLDPNTLVAVAVAANNAALLIGVVYLIGLIKPVWGEAVARRTVLCLLVFPTSIFFSAVYPESLFLACAVGAMFEAHRGRWWLASVLGGLAALTRLYGVLIVLPLAWEYLERRRWRVRRDIAWLALVPVALLVWQLSLYPITGDPLVARHAQDAFDRPLVMPWVSAQALAQSYTSHVLNPSVVGHELLNTAAFVFFAVLVFLTWRLRRISFVIFSVAMFLPTISRLWGTGFAFEGVPRYGLELFPAFVVLGQLTRRRVVLVSYMTLACVASVAIAALVASGWWIA